MKNILKLSFLTFGIALSSSLIAQEQIKTDAAAIADKLETPKPVDSTAAKQEPAKTNKQEPVKTAPATGASKSEAKSDTSGGTRMAISEQGVPKKNKRKSASSTTAPTATPPKK